MVIYLNLNKEQEILSLKKSDNKNTLGFIRLSSHSQVTVNTKRYHKDIIESICKKNNLSYEMVLSIFHYESKGFNPKSINKNTNGRYY